MSAQQTELSVLARRQAHRIHGSRLLFLLATSLMMCVASEAQQTSDRIGDLVAAYAENGIFNGSVLVAKSGEVVYAAGHGLSNKVWDLPNRTHTRYLIGSATKLFTAIITLQLVEDDILSLDSTISEYLPNFPKDYRNDVTIRQLLSHTSGIPDYYTREFHDNYKDRYYPHDAFVELFFADELVELADGEGSYSSANYYTLGLIIEAVSSASFSEVLNERVLEPLGLNDTGYDHHSSVEFGLASGYIRNYLGYHTAQNEIVDSSAFAAGAMYSTVMDLLKVAQALDHSGLLTQQSLEMLQTPIASAPWGRGTRFTLGSSVVVVTLSRSGLAKSVQEFAGNTSSGFTAINTRVLDDDVFVSILSNAGPGYFDNRLHRMKQDILSIIYGEDVDVPALHVEALLGKKIANGIVEDVVADYKELLADSRYSSNERQLNQLGYDLLQTGFIDFATSLFLLNTELHPTSANAHDSLAEAYLRLGEIRQAVDTYSVVLTLDPSERVRKNAEERIASLSAQ